MSDVFFTASLRRKAGKSASIFFASIYFCVNVIGAAPALPAPAAPQPMTVRFASTWRTLVARFPSLPLRRLSSNPVFTFHFKDPTEEIPRPREVPAAGRDDGRAAAPADGEVARDLGQVARHSGDLRGDAGKFVKEEILKMPADRSGPVQNVRLSDLNIDKLPVSPEVKTRLKEAVASSDPRVTVFVNRTTGQVTLQVQGMGDITISQNRNVNAANPSPVVGATNIPAVAPAPGPGGAPAPVVAPAAARPDAAPAAPEVREVKTPAQLRGIGYQGPTGAGQVGNIQGNGRWVSSVDAATGAKTWKFEGRMTWETASGMHYEAKATADGKIEITRTAAGTFLGRDVTTPDGKVVVTDVNNRGQAIARTTFSPGDSETITNGELTGFNATKGPILREVLAPEGARRGGPAGAAGAAGEAAPKPMAGNIGDYVIREGKIDTVFRMDGGKVTMTQMTDNRTGNVIANRVGDRMVGTLGGKPTEFQVLTGPRFDAATGQAQISVNTIHKAGDKATLTPPPPAGGAGGGDGPGVGGNGPAAGHLYRDVSFRAVGGGKFEVTATKDGAVMAGNMSLNGNLTLASGVRMENAVFLNQAGVQIARTLDNVSVVGPDDKPIAGRPPLMAVTTIDNNERQQLARIGVVNTTPFVVPKGVENVTGTVKLGGPGGVTANVTFTMPNGASANLEVKDGKHNFTADTTAAGGETAFDLGPAVIKVDVGVNGAKIDLDTLLDPTKAAVLPAGVTVEAKVKVEAQPLNNLALAGTSLNARVTESNVKVWVNPLTGNLRSGGDGTIKVEGRGFTGTIEVKDGKAQDMTFKSADGRAAVLTFGAPGGPQQTITVPGGREMTMNLQTGRIVAPPADMPALVDGMTMETPQGLQLAFKADTTAPGGVAVQVTSDFKAFGQNMGAGDVQAGRFENGRVVLDLKPASHLILNGNIGIKGADGRPDNNLTNATIIRFEVSMMGGMTGVGRSTMAAGQEVFVPGGSGGGGSPDLSGLKTKDVTLTSVEGGTMVKSKADGAEIAVTVEMGAGDKIVATPVFGTSVAENVTLTAARGPVSAFGQEVTAGSVLLNKNGGNVTIQTLAENSSFGTPGGPSLTVPSAGKTIRYENGALVNNADLAGAKGKVGGVEFTFQPKPGDATHVVPVMTAANTQAFGQAFNKDSFKAEGGQVTGRLEGGRVIFDLATPKTITAPGGNLQLSGNGGKDKADLPATSFTIYSLGFNMMSGEKSGMGKVGITGTTGELTNDMVGLAAPAGAPKPGDPKPATSREGRGATHKDAGTTNVTVEAVKDGDGKQTGVRLTATAPGAQVNATFFEPTEAGGPVRAQLNIFSDFAGNVNIGAGGVQNGTKFYSEGVTFSSREFSQGNYTLGFTKDAYIDDAATGLHLVCDSPTGQLGYKNGQLVENPVGRPEPGATTGLRATSTDPKEQTRGNFHGEANPPALAGPGLTVVGEAKPVRIDIHNGNVWLSGGTTYKAEGDSVAIGDTGLVAKADTFSSAVTFTYYGLDFLATRPVAGIEGGVVRKDLTSREIPEESRDDALKGRSDLKPRAVSYLEFSGNDRALFVRTDIELDGKTQVHGKPALIELESHVVKAKENIIGSREINDIVHVSRNSKGEWQWSNMGGSTGGYDSRAASYGTFSYRGIDYSVSWLVDRNDPAGKARVSVLIPTAGSLRAFVGTDKVAHVLGQNGEMYSGLVRRSSNFEAKAADHRKLMGDAWADAHPYEDNNFFIMAPEGTGGHVFDAQGGKARVEEAGVQLSTHGYYTPLVATIYRATADDGTKFTFSQDKSGIYVWDTALGGADSKTLTLAGQTVTLQRGAYVIKNPDGTVAESRIGVQTVLGEGNIGKTVIAFDNDGMHIGKVVRVDPGNARSYAGRAGGETQWNNFKLGGALALEQRVPEVRDGKIVMEGGSPKMKSIFRFTSDQRNGNSFVIEAGTLFERGTSGSAGWEYTIVKGSIRLEGGSDAAFIGGDDKVNVQGPGASGGQAGKAPIRSDRNPVPDRLSYRVDKVKSGESYVATRGRLVLERGGRVVVTPGTLLVNERLNTVKNFNHPNRIMVVQGDGSLMGSITVQRTQWDHEIDGNVRAALKDVKLDSGTVKTTKNEKGKEAVSLVVLDSSGRTLGFYQVEVKQERSWHGLTRNGQESYNGGHLALLATSEPLPVYENGKKTDVTTQSHVEFDAKSNRIDVVTERGGITRQRVDGVLREGRFERRIETKTNEKGEKQEYHSPSFVYQQDGKEVRVDITPVHSHFARGEGRGKISDEKAAQAEANMTSISGSIGTLMRGGTIDVGRYGPQGVVEYFTTNRAKTAYANYARRDDVGWGVSGFVQTFLLIGHGWYDLAAGTDHTAKQISGEENFWGIGKWRAAKLDEMDVGIAITEANKIQKTSDVAGVLAGFDQRTNIMGSPLRSLDKGVGWLLGFERIMELDTSKIARAQGAWETTKETFRFLGHFALCVGEQTLNFFTFGGGALLSGGGKAAVAANASQKLWFGARAANWINNSKLGQLVQALSATGKTVEGAAQVAGAAEKLGLFSRATGALGKLLFNPVTSTTFTLFMRAKAMDAAHKAVNSMADKDVAGASKDVAAAAWEIVVSEIGWLGPMVGFLAEGSKIAKGIGQLTGFGKAAEGASKMGQLARQAATVAVVGAGVGLANHYISGRQGSVWTSIGAGAGTALAAFTLFKVLGGIGGSVAKMTESLAVKGGVNVEKAGRLVAMGQGVAKLANGVRLFAVGGLANVMFQSMTGSLKDPGKAFLQGGFVALMGAGTLKAMSNWGKTLRNMGGGTLETAKVGFRAFQIDRMKSGLHMAMWEMAFNTVQWNGKMTGERGLINPLTWASAVAKGVTNLMGLVGIHGGHAEAGSDDGIFSAANLKKGADTFQNISRLHPFFAFGRVGTNPLTALPAKGSHALIERGKGNMLAALESKGAARLWYGTIGTAQMKLGKAIETLVVMPLNIKTFELFESGATTLAANLGLIRHTKTDDQTGVMYLADENGNYKLDANGFKIKASEADEIGHFIVKTAGFLNAPIGASTTLAQKAVGERIAESGPRFSDLFRADGGSARRAEAKVFLENVREAGRQGKGMTVEDGRTRHDIDAEGTKQLAGQAEHMLASLPEVGRALTGAEPGQVRYIVEEGGSGRTIRDADAKVTGEVGLTLDASGGKGTVDGKKADASTGGLTRPGGPDGPLVAEGTVKVKGENGAPDRSGGVKATIEGPNARIEIAGDVVPAGRPVEATLTFKIKEGSTEKTIVVRDAVDANGNVKLPPEVANGTAKIIEVGVSVKPMTAARAAEILHAHQTGRTVEGEGGAPRPIVTADQVAAAREVLGVGPDTVVIAMGGAEGKNLHAAALGTYVSSLGRAELRDLADRAANGQASHFAGGLAVGRLQGADAQLAWFGAKNASPAVLHDIAFNFSGTTRVNELGQRVYTGEGAGPGWRGLLSADAVRGLKPEVAAAFDAAGGRPELVLASAAGGGRLVFESARNPGDIVTASFPPESGRTSGTSPPGGRWAPVGEAYKDGVLAKDRDARVEVALGPDGVAMVEVRSSGAGREGASARIDADGMSYVMSGRTAETLAPRIMQNRNAPSDAANPAAATARAEENTALGRQVENAAPGLLTRLSNFFRLAPPVTEIRLDRQNNVADARVGERFTLAELRSHPGEVTAPATDGGPAASTPSNLTTAINGLLAKATPTVGDARRVLEALRETATPEAQNAAYDSAVALFRGSRLTADQKGSLVRALERQATEADRLAAERLTFEVDTRGCSVCFVHYTRANLIAGAATGLRAMISRIAGGEMDEKQAEKYVIDRLYLEAAREGTPDAVRFKEAAEILRQGGNTLEADMMKALGNLAEKPVATAMNEMGGTKRVGNVEISGREFAARSALAGFHKRARELLIEGKSIDEVRNDPSLRAEARKLLDIVGPKETLNTIVEGMDAAEAALREMPDDAAAAIRPGIDRVRATVAQLKAELARGNVDAVRKVTALTKRADNIEVLVGAKQADAAAKARMNAEIDAMPAGPAKTAMRDIFTLSEKHTANYNNLSPAQRKANLIELANKFVELRKAFGLDSIADLKAKMEPFFAADATPATRQAALRAIFGKENLNVGERLAFVLAASAYYFDVKGENPRSQSEVDADRANSGKQFDEGKRAAMMVQFMMGRISGLEAGGGKTPLFIMAFGEYMLRPENAGAVKKGMVGELVTFAKGEVTKYLTEYRPLFEALGMKVVDGVTPNGPEGTKRAIEAYTAEAGVVKIVVTDMNTRGFRENEIQRDPGGELATVMRENVKMKAADEADAQILSRMAFINSEGNLVATGEAIGRAEQIQTAVLDVMGSRTGAELLDRKWSQGGEGGYREFSSGKVGDLAEGGKWFSKVGETVYLSKDMMDAVKSRLKGTDITTGEIVEFVRAITAVRNPTEFGFTRESKDGPEEAHARPTHKKGGEFQTGQIDSSVTFNVAAVLLYRSYLASEKGGAKSEAEIDAIVSMGDIRLSKASASATLIQALQGGKDIHRFAATGTPDALEGIVQATLGLELTQVYSSSYADFHVTGNKTVKEAYDNRGSVPAGEMSIDYVTANGRNQKAAMAAEGIGRSLHQDRNAGVLIGAREELDLRATFEADMKNSGATDGFIKLLSDRGAAVEYLRGKGATEREVRIFEQSGWGIRDVINFAKFVDSKGWIGENATGGNGAKMSEHIGKSDVIDGNGGKGQWADGSASRDSETVAGRMSTERTIVYSTEIGLRGLNFKAGGKVLQSDAIFMGLEMMSSEGRMQAWKRVDRNKQEAVRIEIVDVGVLKARVETAKTLDEAMRTKFGRPEGLFGKSEVYDTSGVSGGRVVVKRESASDILNKDIDKMSTSELVQLASKLTSLENLGASAMFFINEQVEAKLMKEPIAAWKAMEMKGGNKKGEQFMADLQLEILEHTDRKTVEQGSEFKDPRKQALDAFNASAGRAIDYLTRIANNRDVAFEIRVEATQRIADIVAAQRGLMRRLGDTDSTTGMHEQSRYKDAAFVNVSKDVGRGPAMQVADTVVRLADMLLPSSQTSVEAAGPRGSPQRTVAAASTRTGGGVPAGGRDAAFTGSLAKTTPAERAKAEREAKAAGNESQGTLLSYREQALASSYDKMSNTPPSALQNMLALMVAAGILPAGTDTTDTDDASIRAHAVSLVEGLEKAGLREDQMDIGTVMHVLSDLQTHMAGTAPASRPLGNVTAADIAMAVAAPDRREGMAVLVLKAAGLTPEQALDSDNASIQAAGKVVILTDRSRAEGAAAATRPTGSWGSVLTVFWQSGSVTAAWNASGIGSFLSGVSRGAGSLVGRALDFFSPGSGWNWGGGQSGLGSLGKVSLSDAAGINTANPNWARAAAAMVTLTTGIANDDRDGLTRVLDVTAEVGRSSPDSKGDGRFFGRTSLNELAAAGRGDDPLSSLKTLIDSKDRGFFSRELPGWMQSKMGGSLMVSAGAALAGFGVVAAPIGLAMVAVGGAMIAASAVRNEKPWGTSDWVQTGLYGVMVTAALALPLLAPAVGVLAAASNLIGMAGPWMIASFGALFAGNILPKIPGFETVKEWSSNRNLAGATVARRAAGAIDAARENIRDQRRERADAKRNDKELGTLRGQLQAVQERMGQANADIVALFGEMQTIGAKIKAREAEIDREHPVNERVTIGDLLDEIKETTSDKAEQKSVLRIALALLSETEADDGTTGRVDDILDALEADGDLDSSPLLSLEIDQVMDDEFDVSFLGEVAEFEEQLNGGAVTMEAIEAWAGDANAPPTRPDVPALVRYYDNDATDGEIAAARAVARAETAIGPAAATPTTPTTPTTPGASATTAAPTADQGRRPTNEVRALLAAVRGDAVHKRLADRVAAARPDSPLAAAAKELASQQGQALRGIAAALADGKVTPEAARNVLEAVLRNGRLDGNVAQAVADAFGLILTGSPSGADRAFGTNPAAGKVISLLQTYYSPVAAGIAAIGKDGVELSAADLRILALVANPTAPSSIGVLARNWSTEAPYYRGLSVLPDNAAYGVESTPLPDGTPSMIVTIPDPDSTTGGRIAVARVTPRANGVDLVLAHTIDVGAPAGGGTVTLPGSSRLEMRLAADGSYKLTAVAVDSDYKMQASDPTNGRWVDFPAGRALPAGAMFRFVPATGTFDESKADVFQAPAAPKAGPSTTTPTTPTSPVTPASSKGAKNPSAATVPVDIGKVRSLGVMVAQMSSRDPEDAGLNPASVLRRANEVFVVNAAIPSNTAAAPNMAVARDASGAVTRVWVLQDSTGEWFQASFLTAGGPAEWDVSMPTTGGATEFFRVRGQTAERTDPPAASTSTSASNPAADAVDTSSTRSAGTGRSLWDRLTGWMPWSRTATTAGLLGAVFFGMTGTASAADPTGGGASAALNIGALALGFIATGGLVALMGAGLSFVRDAFTPAPTAAGGPDGRGTTTFNYETATGNQAALTISPEVEATAAAMTKSPVERLIAVRVDTTPSGDAGRTSYIATSARPVRAITFDGAPAQETAGLRALARELTFGEVAVPTAGNEDPAAAGKVEALAADGSPHAGWMNMILVSPLLNELPDGAAAALRADPRFADGFKWLDANPGATLGQVRAHGDAAFTRMVYQLVAFNAESIALKEGVLMTGQAYSRLWADGPIALMHTHLDSDGHKASLADRLTAMNVAAFEEENGLEGPGLMLVANKDGSIIGFNAVSDSVLKSGAVAPDIRPVQTRFQSLNVALLPEADGNESWLARLVPQALRARLSPREPGQLVFNLSNPADRKAAEVVVDKVWSLVQSGARPETTRMVFMLAFALGTGRIDNSGVNAYLSRMPDGGRSLKQIVNELSGQFKLSGLVRAGETGELLGIVRGVQNMMPRPDQFGAVSALPAQERNWIVNEMGRIRLNVLDAKAAARGVKELEKELEGVDVFAKVAEPLRALAGLDRADFRARFARALSGTGYAAQSDLEALFKNPSAVPADQRAVVLEAALKLLAPGLLSAVSRTTGAKLDRATLDKLTIKVGLRGDLGGSTTAGVASKSGDQILIGLNPDLPLDRAFAEMVGLLTHEITHLFADDALAAIDLEAFGIPTVAEEAWVQRTTSAVLAELGLKPIANLVDLATYRDIVEQENTKAVYRVFDRKLSGDQKAVNEMKAVVRDSRGSNMVVVLASEADFKEAQRLFAGSGVMVVSTEWFKLLKPLEGETLLETHARLYLGTAKVRLAVADDLAGRIRSKNPAGFAADLRKIITRIKKGASDADFEMLMPLSRSLGDLFRDPMEARFIASQA